MRRRYSKVFGDTRPPDPPKQSPLLVHAWTDGYQGKPCKYLAGSACAVAWREGLDFYRKETKKGPTP